MNPSTPHKTPQQPALPAGMTQGLASIPQPPAPPPPPEAAAVTPSAPKIDRKLSLPLRKSAMYVDWEMVFTQLFRRVSPERISEVKEALVSFEGMYEAAFTSICRHYRSTVPIEYRPIPIDPTSNWTKYRVARIIIRNRGAATFHMPQLEDALRDLSNPKSTPEIEFEKLEAKFGPEPLPTDFFSLNERLTLACAMSGKMEVRQKFQAQVNVQGENPEVAFRNALEELPSGEVLWEDLADPRDIRTRFKAILTLYDKPLLPRMESILASAEDPVALFTKLQRTYGPEPHSSSIFDNQRSTSNDPNTSALSHVVDTPVANALAPEQPQQTSEQATQQQALQTAHLESLRNDIFIMPKSTEHPRNANVDRVFDTIVNLLVQSLPVGTEDLIKMTTGIFEVLDRSMLNVVNQLCIPRITADHDYEAQEWMQYIHCFYVNCIPPQTNNVSLRTVVSLLYSKLGGAIWEVKAAGGVDAFMDKAGAQDAQEQQDRAFNLRVMYGSVPDESELAVRNQKRIWFSYYNPAITLDKMDATIEKILATMNRDGRRWEDFFRTSYGPQPRPLNYARIEVRARDILRRFAHTKENDWQTIALAHTNIGDGLESVIRNMVRTYGPERSTYDDLLEQKVLAYECENRFRIFAHEMRTRDVILRRATAALSSADPNAAKKIGSRALEQRLLMQKMLIAKTAEEERKKAEKSKNDLQSLQYSQIDALISQEEEERKDIEIDERAMREPIVAVILSILPESDEDVMIEVSETMRRHFMLDVARAKLKQLHELMRKEGENLQLFLADRLLWRKKWERDEEIRIAILEMKDYEKQRKAEAQAARENAQRSSANPSSIISSGRTMQHSAQITQLYDQLNAQVKHNLSFSVEVENHRAQYRAEKLAKVKPSLDAHAYKVPVATLRHNHPGCCFNNESRFAPTTTRKCDENGAPLQRPNPYMSAGYQALLDLQRNDAVGRHSSDAPADFTEEEMNYMFIDQLREYIQYLFHKYDPKLEGTERQLLKQFIGNEAKLVAALEQQYNVDHWMETHLHHRITEYYRRMAPEFMDEIPSIIQRFIGNEEAMWDFLKNRHGPVPALQSEEMQRYIHSRLLHYFSQRAPHLIPDIDRYIIVIGDTNGDEVFRELAKTYGPEDPQIQLDTLIRKLRKFYRERGIRRQFDDIPHIARRFLGHQRLLNKMLLAKFDDTLQGKKPDVNDFKHKK